MHSDDPAAERYELPGIGPLVLGEDGSWATPPLPTPAIAGDVTYMVYDPEEFEDELLAVDQAISNFRNLPADFFLTHAARATYAYYIKRRSKTSRTIPR
ncbi:hypothetical protein FOB82_11110 [Corynebacterium xerosis]|uniref:Uncharacterized protein n=1 Tax=Corynebacterium xerosis TaxID=1725 RepID=A0A6B8TWA8_9CORY|nr:hypothetical protein [Corynebacterium xerosis]QGS35403.1 hypothetical protein FOB82_11110 [Corynebacterium xerosis]